MIRCLLLLLFLASPALRRTAGAAPPANDDFANATVQTGPVWLTTGTLHGAGSEPNEPILTGFPNGPTAWWQWTAPATGGVRLRTWGTELPNMLAIYRGATLDTSRLIKFASGHFDRAYSAEVRFDATAGVTYRFQVLGADYLSSTAISNVFLPSRVQLSLISGAGPPANDAFANPVLLTGNSPEALLTTLSATGEAGEPGGLPGAGSDTVWAAWTAPADGLWSVNTRQTDFDCYVAVYTGNAVNALTRLNYANQALPPTGGPDVGGGILNFRATAGTTYRIQLQSSTLAGGPFGVCRLRMQPAVAPAHDQFAAALTLSGSVPAADGDATYATRETGEPGSQGDESGSLWWQWTAPASGLLAVIQYSGTTKAWTGTAVNALTALPLDSRSGARRTLGGVTDFYPVSAGTVVRLRSYGDDRVRFALRLLQTPPNDEFASRATLSGTNATDAVEIDNGSWEPNEPETDGLGPPTVWYRWTAPSAGRFVIHTQGSPEFVRVKVWTGTAAIALTTAGEQVIGNIGPSAYGRIFLNAAAGTEYAIQLQKQNRTPGLSRITIRPAAPPVNDQFASPTVVSGGAWSAAGSNVDATVEINEPFPQMNNTSPAASVWWRWTATASGRFRLTTAGSTFDNVLTVSTGGTLTAQTRIAEDASAGFGSTGAVNFDAVSGTVYNIRIDGQSAQEGSIALTLQPAPAVPNDAFANRLPLTGANVTLGGTLTGASVEAGEPNPAGANGGRSVWYDWTAPASGTAFFRVVGERFSPAFGLYSGTAVGSLTSFVTGGSGAGNASPQTFSFAFAVNNGSAYRIRIDGAPAGDGRFTLTVSMPAPPLQDAFAARSRLTGPVVRTSVNNEGATAQAGEPAHAGTAALHSVWFEWTAPASGPVLLDTNGSSSAARPRVAIYTGTALNALTAVAGDTITGAETFANLSFNAAAGTTYLIAADTTSGSRGDLAINLATTAATLPNDAFATPAVWTGDAAEAVVDLRGASAEANEPAHAGQPAARSLWWRWTPQTSRRARLWFETSNPTTLVRLALYRDGPINGLVPIAATTTDSTRTRLEADVIAGETYRVVLDSPALALFPGYVRLGAAPVNGTSENALPIIPADGTLTASLTGAINTDPALLPSQRRELFWTWTAPVNSRMEWRASGAAGSGLTVSASVTAGNSPVSLNGSLSSPVPGTGDVLTTFDAAAGFTYLLRAAASASLPLSVSLTETLRQPAPANDFLYNAVEMSGSSWSVPLTLGAEPGDRQWWRWTSPAAGTAEVRLTGSLAESDQLLAVTLDYQSVVSAGAARTDGGPPVLRLSGPAGTPWVIITRTALRRLRPATLTLTSPAPGAAPANDSWETPQILPASFGPVISDVNNATCQPNEPDHSNSGGTGVATSLPPGRSLWYDWTPAVSGPVSLYLESAAGLALRIYTGRQRSEWLPVRELLPGASQVAFHAYAGETYHIAVATRPPVETTGSFTLRLGGPANDHVANAILLTGNVNTSTIESGGATIQEGEPGYGFNAEPPRASLWWRWTAGAAGSVWLDTRGSAYDTVLTVFGSDPPDTTSRIAENDNASTFPGVGTSALRFTAAAGQSYLIRVTRRDSADPSGPARLTLTTTAPPEPYARWLQLYPGLTGPDSSETADPDKDGLTNLLELAFGTDPQTSNPHPTLVPAATETGWQIETTLDRDALDALGQGTSLEAIWQISRDLQSWYPAPAASPTGRSGSLFTERLTLTREDPPFARLLIRRGR